jgi:hypothetical protein
MGQTVPRHQKLLLYKRKQSTLGHLKSAAPADLGKFLSVPLADFPWSIIDQSYLIVFHELDSHFEEPRGVQKPRTQKEKKNH